MITREFMLITPNQENMEEEEENQYYLWYYFTEITKNFFSGLCPFRLFKCLHIAINVHIFGKIRSQYVYFVTLKKSNSMS